MPQKILNQEKFFELIWYDRGDLRYTYALSQPLCTPTEAFEGF
jgi:hypothetical protein